MEPNERPSLRECGETETRVTFMIIRVAFVAAVMALSGCTTSGLGGGRIPSPGGGGNNVAVAGTIIAAMDGGLIGGTIGSQLDAADRRTALQAEYRALEYSQAGNTVDWRGASAGVSGAVTAAQPYRVGSQDCRQYSQTVSLNGQKQTARGTACRNPDGSWTPLT